MYFFTIFLNFIPYIRDKLENKVRDMFFLIFLFFACFGSDDNIYEFYNFFSLTLSLSKG